MVPVSARSVVIAWGVVLGAIAAGCALSDQIDGVFGSNEAVGGAGGTGTSSSSSSASSSTTSSSSSSVSSTTSSSSSSSTTSSSTGGSDVVVYCNDAPCMAGEVCCFQAGTASQGFCGAPNSCPDGFIELSCNDPTDCPGQVCCGDWNGQTYTGVSCQDMCQGILQCEGDPNVCPVGQGCFPSGILGTGYSFCQ